MNNDLNLTPLDVLLVINRLNGSEAGTGEGESSEPRQLPPQLIAGQDAAGGDQTFDPTSFGNLLNPTVDGQATGDAAGPARDHDANSGDADTVAWNDQGAPWRDDRHDRSGFSSARLTRSLLTWDQVTEPSELEDALSAIVEDVNLARHGW